MALMDTSDQARQRQLDIYAAMTGADKVTLAIEMAEQSKNIAIDGIRSRGPQLSEKEVHQAWLSILHGDLADSLQDSRASRTS